MTWYCWWTNSSPHIGRIFLRCCQSASLFKLSHLRLKNIDQAKKKNLLNALLTVKIFLWWYRMVSMQYFHWSSNKNCSEILSRISCRLLIISLLTLSVVLPVNYRAIIVNLHCKWKRVLLNLIKTFFSH